LGPVGQLTRVTGPAAELSTEEREAYQRGRQHFERGEPEAALPYLERLLTARRHFPDVLYMIALIHEQRGELEACRARLEEAVRINPGYAEAVLALRTIYERLGDFERARALAASSARAPEEEGPLDATTRGKLANLQAALGDAYRDVGELRDAIECYRKALDRCPGFHDIRYRLASALREAGLPDQALRELRRILRANPDFLAAQVQLGLTYYTLGRTPDAVREWREALQRDPARREAHWYLRMVGAEAAPAGPDEAAGPPPDAPGEPSAG
jgi:tetratricopeptide (TPR) repeat protein